MQAFLVPKRPAGYWRPALAFASFAAVLAVTALLWHTATPDNSNALAELREPTTTRAPAAPAMEPQPARPPLKDMDNTARNAEAEKAEASAPQARTAAPVPATAR